MPTLRDRIGVVEQRALAAHDSRVRVRALDLMIQWDSRERLLKRIKMKRVKDELSGELKQLAKSMAEFLKVAE